MDHSRVAHAIVYGPLLVVDPQDDGSDKHQYEINVRNAGRNDVPHEEASYAYSPAQPAPVGADDGQATGHLSEGRTAIFQHQYLVGTIRDKADKNEAKKEDAKVLGGYRGRIAHRACLTEHTW